MVDRVEEHLAAYAIRSADAGVRVHNEPDDPLRSPLELDRHRIIESTSFRRLEGKTQVFTAAYHDHFRTRLTHTLEAAQIARCLAVSLRANETLAETITLAHDLGHPPFGHAGEKALGELMASHGGFDHNVHTLRVVGYLEHPFPAFRGLNLTAETRAGLSAHATPFDVPSTPLASPGPSAPSVEAQIASIADRIAYNCHDLEDAIGAEFIGLDELAEVTLWREAFEKAVDGEMTSHIPAVRRVVLDALLNDLMTDAISTSRALLTKVGSSDEAKASSRPLITFSDTGNANLVELESFIATNVYQHGEVVEMDTRGREMVTALFEFYRGKPVALPDRFVKRIADQGAHRVICDYIAGMTDRFCRREYEKCGGV
ncbi:MAG: dNTP triphosphohydrolase [Phycisphaerales bacterium]|nr:MAG: dNTP triphosphohydrolase [Phycisphaerales bacterium]